MASQEGRHFKSQMDPSNIINLSDVWVFSWLNADAMLEHEKGKTWAIIQNRYCLINLGRGIWCQIAYPKEEWFLRFSRLITVYWLSHSNKIRGGSVKRLSERSKRDICIIMSDLSSTLATFFVAEAEDLKLMFMALKKDWKKITQQSPQLQKCQWTL